MVASGPGLLELSSARQTAAVINLVFLRSGSGLGHMPQGSVPASSLLRCVNTSLLCCTMISFSCRAVSSFSCHHHGAGGPYTPTYPSFLIGRYRGLVSQHAGCHVTIAIAMVIMLPIIIMMVMLMPMPMPLLS